jgi:hypothetical protein
MVVEDVKSGRGRGRGGGREKSRDVRRRFAVGEKRLDDIAKTEKPSSDHLSLPEEEDQPIDKG